MWLCRLCLANILRLLFRYRCEYGKNIFFNLIFVQTSWVGLKHFKVINYFVNSGKNIASSSSSASSSGRLKYKIPRSSVHIGFGIQNRILKFSSCRCETVCSSLSMALMVVVLLRTFGSSPSFWCAFRDIQISFTMRLVSVTSSLF